MVSAEIWARYSKLTCCGKGVYGKVYKAIRKDDMMLQSSNPTLVAIKKTKIDPSEGVSATSLREIMALEATRGHPFIITLYERLYTPTAIWMVLEFCEQDLHSLIRTRRIGLDMNEVKHITLQLLLVLVEFRKHNILHRDLKPANIMVKRHPVTGLTEIRVIDFGLCRINKAGGCGSVTPFSPEVQTVLYRAPELFLQPRMQVGEDLNDPTKRYKEVKAYSDSVDVWSVGCILAEALNGSPLFIGTSELNVIQKIVNTLGKLPTQTACGAFDDKQMDEMYVNFAGGNSSNLYLVVPRLRAEGQEEGLNLLQDMLKYNPKERVDALDAIQHAWFEDIGKLEPYMSLIEPWIL